MHAETGTKNRNLCEDIRKCFVTNVLHANYVLNIDLYKVQYALYDDNVHIIMGTFSPNIENKNTSEKSCAISM
jgi:hypothetical protein